MITVAITDDNDIIRNSVIRRLKDSVRFVYEASSAESMLRFLKSNPATVHPQVILMDIEMGEIDGIEATAMVKEMNPNIKVVMLTVFEDDEKIMNAIKAGADGYCVKDEKKDRILECINDVVTGGSYMSPSVARKAMKYLQQIYKPVSATTDNPLTKRETEILQMVVNGSKYADIGELLFITTATVKTHIYHIYEKLHVSNKMQAMQLAKQKGWL